MKTINYKQVITSLSILFFLTLVIQSCRIANGNQNKDTIVNGFSIPSLKERNNALANAAEWPKTKEKVNELINKIKNKPEDAKLRIQLANIYMNEARITSDAYYHQAAYSILNSVLATDANNFEAYTFQASIAMSLHQFATAKQLANKALSINPNNAYVHGVLVDANVELGDYTQAITHSDAMQKLKPSLEAYSRASYLREIFGDIPGAIQAMKLAVIAGAAGSESAEWARTTLAELYNNYGMLDSAENLYKTALVYRPNYPTALIGLAKVEKNKKNYTQAIKYTEQAIAILSEASYVSLLGELYKLDNNTTKSNSINNDVVDLLLQAEKEQQNNKVNIIKHNANRELANAYLQIENYNKALEYALNDWQLRPNNIDANELVAWIYYLKNDAANAQKYATTMLSTNTKNATTLYKAGLIALLNNNTDAGNSLIAKAKQSNGNINLNIASTKG
jgi:tetratricopeptide (TPR) repeat protein